VENSAAGVSPGSGAVGEIQVQVRKMAVPRMHKARMGKRI
jgi:hypothetical protein